MIQPGHGNTLGATVEEHGVNFALASHWATAVEVCLFDEANPLKEIARYRLPEQTNHVFHGHLGGVKAGALYGFRVHGPWAPYEGQRFNPNKLLVDPYARALRGEPDWKAPLTAHVPGSLHLLDPRDSGFGVPRSVVVNDSFDWQGVKAPRVPWHKTVLYELHVRGFTKLHPAVPPHERGTYRGLAHPRVIEHLKSLNVTAVELLPIHESVSEGFLRERGLTNYWGYNTLGFFAPEQRYASVPGAQVEELKYLVRELHRAGIEVILDVVYNHTCEGGLDGPTLSLRGADNATYYWQGLDFTGCGNSLAVHRPLVLQLVMDSLRTFAREFHIDGFRFDLAPTLARGPSTEFDPNAAFFTALFQDPELSRLKLIAEPWDVGPGGYRLGNFPLPFAEWNDRYRTTLRRFWRGDSGLLPELGTRLAGSSDFFKLSGRRPHASVNYVACHDGFTLADLTRYANKHNEANREDNRDGTPDNQSFNHGHEGETVDAVINAARDRTARNLLASLFLSVGTPMLQAGDEMGRTQRGNNNAYCQDNEVSWLDWALDERQQKLLDFTRALSRLRAATPALQRRHFFKGETVEDARFRDLVWFHPSGRELTHDDWHDPEARCFGVFMGDGPLLVYFNALARTVPVTLPPPEDGVHGDWELVFETASDVPRAFRARAPAAVQVPGRAILVFRLRH